jgi:hypothetical protein
MALSSVSAVSEYKWTLAGEAVIAQRRLVSPAATLWNASDRECCVTLLYKHNIERITTCSWALLPKALQPNQDARALVSYILATKFSFDARALISPRCLVIASHIAGTELLAPCVRVRVHAFCLHARRS